MVAKHCLSDLNAFYYNRPLMLYFYFNEFINWEYSNNVVKILYVKNVETDSYVDKRDKRPETVKYGVVNSVTVE